MFWAYILVPGIAASTVAVLSYAAGAGLGLSLASYFVTGFGGAVGLMLWAGLRPTPRDSAASRMAQIELELAALEESILRDERLRAGSPDCLAPLLFRSLHRQEERQQRKLAAKVAQSDFVVTSAR